MKTKIAIVAAAVMLSSSAFAATQNATGGRVDFYGNVTNTSCTISVDGQGSDANVYLAPVGYNELKNNVLLKPTQFHIDVSDCQVKPQKEPVADVPNTITTKWTHANQVMIPDGDAGDVKQDSGWLVNDAVDGAKNIYLALSTTTKIDNKIIPGLDTGVVKTLGENVTAARFTYNVGYVTASKSKVTAGPVHSYAVYEVTYN